MSLNRRTFFEWSARGAVLGATGVTGLLAACTPAAPRPTATAAPTPGSRQVTSPTYLPLQGGVQSDLPGNASGLDPAYFKFPSQLTKSVPQVPGDGSDVSAIVVLTYA